MEIGRPGVHRGTYEIILGRHWRRSGISRKEHHRRGEKLQLIKLDDKIVVMYENISYFRNDCIFPLP